MEVVDTTESLLGAFSSDKLAFRLRLAGGACRAATSEVLATCLPLLEPIVTSPAFYNHDEKAVRVATSKLLKDILKGATSLYPTALEPVYAVNADRPVGYPNTPCVGNVKWHVPSAEALPGFVRVLRTVISNSMRDTQQCIQDAVAGDGTNSSAGSARDGTTSPATSELSAPTATAAGAGGMVFKKTEELIVSRLTMIEKALRGAAEILGDVASEPEDLTIPAHTPSWQLTSTGRGRLIESLVDPADRLYLQTLRIEVVRFLIALQEAFYTQIPADHAYSALKNNITVQTLWLELFNLVIVRRMACLKDIESVRKYLRYSVKSSRSSVTNVVYHRLKEHAHRTGKAGTATAPAEGAWRQQIATAEYWKYHDSSTSAIACLAWAQHIVRCRAVSSEAVRRCNVPSFVRCLDVLLQRLCNHEYDQIRKVALKQFDAVSTRFGSKMVATVEGVLNSLNQEQTLAQAGARSYWAVSGTLSVLAQSRVQKRILSDSQLLQQFLRTLLLDAQRIIQGATEEADKREKLTLKVVEVLLRYVKSWCAAPMLAGTEDNDFMVNLALSCAGGTQGEEAKSALGLRFETFAAFMVLHVIGRPPGIDLQRPDDSNVHTATVASQPLWQWTLSTLGNPSLHSQPPQNVALAALSRLAFLLSQSATGAGAQDPAVQSCVAYVRSMLSPTAPTSTLRAVITSAALSHPRGAEDGMSAQWGSGIEPVLQASQFLKNVVPRRMHGLRSDQNAYSRNFRKEDAALYMSLARAGLLWDSSAGTEDMFAAAHLKALFDSVADLPSSSENETRLNNATRAELFAGVLRAYRQYALHSGAINTDNAAAAVFLQTLKDGVEKASLDYARDWFEAVNFAFLDLPCRSAQGALDPIAAYVLERLEQVVLIPTAQSRATAGDQEGGGDSQQGADSFTNQSKVLCMTCALLRADQEASYLFAHRSGSSDSGLGQEVLRLVLSYADSGLVSPYRSTRNDLAYLLHMLTENTATGRSEAIVEICAKLAAACEGGAAATATVEDGAVVPVNPAQVLQFKNAAETVCLLLRCAVHNVPHWRFHGTWSRMFAAALIGAGSMTSSAIEAAKMCHDTCLLVCNAIVRTRLSSVTANDLVGELLAFLLTTAQDKSTPLHSRETLMKCGAVLMANNWYTLTADERKVCRDIFAAGLDDVKPEVQRLAQAGMVAYLALFKTSTELAAIAAVYVKNSDILVAREKKLRRQSEGGGASARLAVDTKHQNTVYMMSCVILATPYDLPADYLPALLTELTRHAVVPALKDIVARTVQLFKRTHQDRWEEFKHAFSADQLDELQGTGAAHYFS